MADGLLLLAAQVSDMPTSRPEMSAAAGSNYFALVSNDGMSPAIGPLTATICLFALLGPQSGVRREGRAGTKVWLGVPCASGQNARQLLVRYVAHGKLWLNDYPFDEAGLRAKVAQIMANMGTKRLWIAADQRMSYGEVAVLIEPLQGDTPDLMIGIATKSQIGPVDPSQFAIWRDQKNHPHLAQPLPPCFPRPAYGGPAQ